MWLIDLMEVGAVSETGSSSAAVAIVDGSRVRVECVGREAGYSPSRGQHAARPRERPPHFTHLCLFFLKNAVSLSPARLHALELQCRQDSALIPA